MIHFPQRPELSSGMFVRISDDMRALVRTYISEIVVHNMSRNGGSES